MIIDVLIAGLNALREYIALHVLTCLIPVRGLPSSSSMSWIKKKGLRNKDKYSFRSRKLACNRS